jgi:membrane protein YdbS with pleckstrin-like domain
MLTEEEKEFLIYWEKNRKREKKTLRQFFFGLPIGLFISAGIILSLDLNWYPRANMVANASLNPYVLFIAVIAIAIFTAIFYKKHQWDMKEQHYRELLYKKEKEQDGNT